MKTASASKIIVAIALVLIPMGTLTISFLGEIENSPYTLIEVIHKQTPLFFYGWMIAMFAIVAIAIQFEREGG